MDLDSISPASHIEILEVKKLVLNGDNSLLYIMKRYPKLKNLKINGGRGSLVYDPVNYVGSMVSTQDKISVSVVAKFMFYVVSISNHDIRRLYTSASVADIL